MSTRTQAPLANDEFDEMSIFQQAMAGKWKDLLTDFKTPDFPQEKKITKAEDTILHMAVNSGNKSDTKKLVDGVWRVEVLRATNMKKNTPLHLAAALGYDDLCEYMIEAEKKIMPVDDKEVGLIKTRNEDGETPFFRSVFHGRRKVFEYFLGIIMRERPVEDEVRELCRRNDGDTVLHCSIAHEFFGTWVDPLVVGSFHKEFKRDEIDDTNNSFLPKNYETLEKFFRGIIRLFSKNSNQKHQQSDLNEFLGNQRIKDLEGQKVLRPGLNLTHIPIDSQGPKLEPHELGIGDGGSESMLGKNPTEGPTHQTQPIHIDSEGGISRYFPPNYTSLVYIIKHLLQIPMILLGFEFGRFQRIKTQKEKHIWAGQVMKALINNESSYIYVNTGKDPGTYSLISKFIKSGDMELLKTMVPEEPQSKDSKETPILTAAKLGIVEMVEEIEKIFPVAIHDTDINNKNVVLLAVENRQPLVYEYLLNKHKMNESIFQEVDKDGNSALHLAAASNEHQPPLIPGAALQMQWEIKWFKYIEDSYPMNFVAGVNKKRATPNEVFSRTHKYLIKEGVMFLAILTSRFEEKDFHRDLPFKLIIGLTSLYFSLAATFVAFCAGHFFVLQEKLKYVAFPIYGITCLPISFFAYALFPLYVDLFKCTFRKVPPRTYREFPSNR